MPQDYEVQSGDCMSSIAYQNGFFWKTLWNLSENSALKAKRKNPNVLMPGDSVHIPDLTQKQETGATEQRHKFMLKGVPETLRIKLVDAAHKPRPNLEYTLIIDGISRKGKTDGNGELNEKIMPDAKSGKLSFATAPGLDGRPIPGEPKMQLLTINLGNLDPITEPSGIKSRLKNLGLLKGTDDSPEALKNAIRGFQKKFGLAVSGVADDATKAKLQSLHGH